MEVIFYIEILKLVLVGSTYLDLLEPELCILDRPSNALYSAINLIYSTSATKYVMNIQYVFSILPIPSIH